MIRVLCLVAGLTGAVGASQAPEFSQQYLQRLAGQVDELTRLAEAFDQTALAEGLGREEMLQAMAATPLVAGQSTMWRSTFARHARLSENLTVLRAATPVERLTLPHRMADPETLQAVWSDFKPAVPVSVAGAASAGAGFIVGWAAILALFAFLAMPFSGASTKRAPTRRPPMAKAEPQLRRPTLVATSTDNRPRLAGVQR